VQNSFHKNLAQGRFVDNRERVPATPKARNFQLFLGGTAPSPTPGHGLLGTFGSACVGAGALPARGQMAAMPQATITTDFYQPFDVHLALTAQITFNFVGLRDEITQTVDLSFGQVLNTGIGVHARCSQRFVRPSAPNAKNIGQPNFNPLIPRKIYTFNTCHVLLSLSLFMLWIFTNYIYSALALDNFALGAAFLY
jgi:hypothetical protein